MLSLVKLTEVQFSSVQFSSVQFSSVQFSSVQFSSVQFSSVQFSSVQFSSVSDLSAQDVSGVSRSNASSLSFVSNRAQPQTSSLRAEPCPGALHVSEDNITRGSEHCQNSHEAVWVNFGANQIIHALAVGAPFTKQCVTSGSPSSDRNSTTTLWRGRSQNFKIAIQRYDAAFILGMFENVLGLVFPTRPPRLASKRNEAPSTAPLSSCVGSRVGPPDRLQR